MCKSGSLSLSSCSSSARKRSNGLIKSVTILSAVLLLLMGLGCSSHNSTRTVPTLPILPSLQRLELEGIPGVWMDSADAGRLSVWIYDVTGEDGKAADKADEEEGKEQAGSRGD